MAVSASVPGGRKGDPEAAFAALQARLRPFESTDDAARAEEWTVLAIPSINLDRELLVRHREDIAAQDFVTPGAMTMYQDFERALYASL
jgi:hypothetical protein